MQIINPESMSGAVVRKSNDLIEAKYQIHDLGEQRVIFMLLAQIQPSDEDFKTYRLSVSDFAQMLGLKGNSTYDTLDKITRSLVSRTITVRNDKSFLHMNWLSSAEYKHGSGCVELAFDPKLKPYLLQLKSHFTQYKLDSVLFFKSMYAIRLYEYLKKEAYKAKAGVFEKYFEYAELREIFSVDKNKYLNFGHFKSKAIVPAVFEIDSKSDLAVYDVKYGKIGKKIANVTFYVQIRSENESSRKARKVKTEEQPQNETQNHSIIYSLVDLGFSVETAHKFKNKYGIRKIERNIAYALAKKQEGAVKDVPAYLNKAIEGDWGGAWDIENKKSIHKKKKILQVENAKKLESEKKAAAEKKVNDQLLENFFLLPKEEKSILILKFLDGMNGILKKSQVKNFHLLGEDAIREYKVSRALFVEFLKGC